eukprot:6311595-Ditylum_brightwellii.AAC.1
MNNDLHDEENDYPDKDGHGEDDDDGSRTRVSRFSESTHSAVESHASGTINTFSESGTTNLTLSEKERKVWDDWDRKDTEFQDSVTRGSASVVSQSMLSTSIMSSSTNTVSRLSQLEERQKRAQHLERRARAHEKLLLFAYSALSVPPPSIVVEKGEMSSISKQKLSMKSDSSSENSNKDKRN